MLEFIRDK